MKRPAVAAEKHCELDGPVSWFRPGSKESRNWLEWKTGFGYKRIKSYIETAQPRREANRSGNRHGELAGRVIFYQAAKADTDYAYMPDNPVFHITKGQHLYAKAFLACPLNRIPIGQNNLPWETREDVQGRGWTILAAQPRVIAVFVRVNGVQQRAEHFCQKSSQEIHKYYKEQDLEPALLPARPVTGSFLTYYVTRAQDPYCFIHFPLIGSARDANMTTGHYGETMMNGFSSLVERLEPGEHRIEFSVYYWYDHDEFDYYVMNKGPNPLGRWRSSIWNERLKDPHPEPDKLVGSSGPIASGSCTICLKENYENLNTSTDLTTPRDSDLPKITKVINNTAL